MVERERYQEAVEVAKSVGYTERDYSHSILAEMHPARVPGLAAFAAKVTLFKSPPRQHDITLIPCVASKAGKASLGEKSSNIS